MYKHMSKIAQACHNSPGRAVCFACRAFNCKYSKASSLAENLTFLREMLRELGRGHKVVVFVLDEFDLFAKKAKQTTLYNLLDAMQTADMQVIICKH